MPLKEFVEKEKTNAGSKAPTRPRFHILYVEDEDVNWQIAQVHLQDKYQMTRARDASEVFSALRQHTFHAILMDIQLSKSDLNGIDITRVLRGRFHGRLPPFAGDVAKIDVPIIFLTAYAARYKVDELMEHGGDALMTKPVNFVALASVLTRAILNKLKPVKDVQKA